MSELQISPAVLATVGCTIMTILAIVSSVVFYKKNGNKGDNPGTVLSIVLGIPFFFALCYMMFCIMEKVGKTV